MANEPLDTTPGGIFRRTWRRLRRPSTHWSVLALLVIGIAIGFAATVGTHVMVEVTGTDKFCGTACHSMQWVAQEHRASVHVANHSGVRAGCHDCHIPKHYPELLWYKAKAGVKDAIGEMRGVISTKEKFEKERLRMARLVWEEYKGNNSQNCRNCHEFTPEVMAKQKEFARPMHQQVLEGKATCIDCHKGVGHNAPSE
jgi:nitrate/TMAO reductase-like tetraheme cytochrome c subunit